MLWEECCLTQEADVTKSAAVKREIIAASVAAGTQVIKDRLFIFIIVLHMYFSNSTSRINGYTAIKEKKRNVLPFHKQYRCILVFIKTLHQYQNNTQKKG